MYLGWHVVDVDFQPLVWKVTIRRGDSGDWSLKFKSSHFTTQTIHCIALHFNALNVASEISTQTILFHIKSTHICVHSLPPSPRKQKSIWTWCRRVMYFLNSPQNLKLRCPSVRFHRSDFMIFTPKSHHNLVPVDQNLVLVYRGVILEAGDKISTS